MCAHRHKQNRLPFKHPYHLAPERGQNTPKAAWNSLVGVCCWYMNVNTGRWVLFGGKTFVNKTQPQEKQ